MTLVDLYPDPVEYESEGWYTADCSCGWRSFPGGEDVTINYALVPHLEERPPRLYARYGYDRLVTEW